MSDYVLITGASSGIGREFSRLFARDKHDLILVARNAQDLAELATELQKNSGIKVVTIPIDLSKPDSAQKLFDEVEKQKLSVEILVNDAGFGSGGKFWEIDAKHETEEITLNILTLTLLTKFFLPKMIARKSGKILNLASVAAFMPGPFMSVYFASKAYVLSFSTALREELRGTGIQVTVLCPRQTASGFAERAGVTHTHTFTHNLLTPQQVAQKGYDGLMNHQELVFSDSTSHLMTIGLRLLPLSVAAKFVKNANT